MYGLMIFASSFKHWVKFELESILVSTLGTELDDELSTVNKLVSTVRAGWVDLTLNLYCPDAKPEGRTPLIRDV